MPKNIWLLIIGMLVIVTGGSFLWPIHTIYMHDELGKSLTLAGVVLMVNSAVGLLGNLFGGYLFDKIGGYRSILLGGMISVISLVGLAFWSEWLAYVVFFILLGFGSGIVFPSMFAMVGTVWPEGERRGFNAVYMAQNVGVALGPALAGFIASAGYRYLFLANLVTDVLFLLLVLFGYRKMNGVVKQEKVEVSHAQQTADRASFFALLIVSVSIMICWIGYSQWPTTLATYTQSLGISLKEYSLLWTINGAILIVAQPIVNRLVRPWDFHLHRQLVLGFFIMLVSFIVVGFAGDFRMFVVAIVIITIGEMFVLPVIPTIAHRLAPTGKEGFYQGIVNGAATLGRMIGPFAGGVVVDQYGMVPLVVIVCILYAIAFIPSVLYEKPLGK